MKTFQCIDMTIMEEYKKGTKTVINGVTMNFCPNCGNKVNREDNFCSACGVKLQAERVYPQEEVEVTKTFEDYEPGELEFESQPAIYSDRPMIKQSWITSVGTFVSRTNEIIKYLKTWRRRRLYKQWVEASSLPPEAIPEELAIDTDSEIVWKKFKLFLLYVALGTAALILFAGLVLLALRSC